jgi:uncharacterized protein YxeA
MMRKILCGLIAAIFLAIAVAKYFYNKSASWEKNYEAEKEAHEALKLKRKQENENANRLSEIKKTSFNNQESNYRDWADKPVPDDFKLLMQKVVDGK